MISHFRKAFNYSGLLYNNHHHNVLEIQILRKKITCACKQKLHFLKIFEFYFIYFLYNRSLLVISFIQISVYMSNPITQFITPPPLPPHCFPPLVSIHLFSTSVSQFVPCKPVHLYHFSRFHIYAIIYDICFSTYMR